MAVDNKRLIKELKNIYKSIGAIIDLLENSYVKNDRSIKKTNEADEQELKEQWQMLQAKYDGSSDSEKLIDEFIASKTKKYLLSFIKANDLPIQAKESKSSIANNIKGLLKVGSTITGNKNV